MMMQSPFYSFLGGASGKPFAALSLFAALCAGMPAMAAPPSAGAPSLTMAAAPVTTAQPGTPADQLSALQAQIPVLEAQARIAELRQKIANPGGATQPAAGAPMAFGTVPPRQDVPAPARAHAVSQPQVLAITGYAQQMQASLSTSGGKRTVMKGDQLADGWTVTDITASAVVLSRKGKTLSLHP